MKHHSNQLRVHGKYASKLQRALFEAEIWKAQAKMLMSIFDGQADTIRRLTEELQSCKQAIK